ncbi:hypothetical protein FOA52_015039 [Chlamydomonas sp. UWO 241]|nr:hypothetical protein FOA52_015039 [Chlamydomonas sp. UWO 241]
MKRGRDEVQAVQNVKRAGASGQRGAPAPVAPAGKLTTSDALQYLRDVKSRFADQKNVYETFLEIMKEFKSQRIDTAGVIKRVKTLFKGHRELILGFNTFLPKGYEIELARVSSDEEEDEEAPGRGEYIRNEQKAPIEFDQAIHYVNKIKQRFASDDRVYKAFLEILNMYRKGHKSIHVVYNEVALLFKQHIDLLEEFTFFLPDAQAVHREQRGRGGFRGGRGGGGGARGAGSVVASSAPEMRSMHKRKAARKATEGFRAGYGYDDEESRKPALARELQYFERVKARLHNRDAYHDMIKCIHMYNQEIIPRAELVGLVADIIGKHTDLMAGFHEFLVKCETMDTDMTLTLTRGGQPMGTGGRDALRNVKAMSKDKMLSKPLSEIVSGVTERITPSYVRIPAAYPKLTSQGRTAIGASVLNDVCVNVITGSEDGSSFKLMRKNQYEESLFKCEDDCYEFDMAVEANTSAMNALKRMYDQILTLPEDARPNYRLHDTSLSPTHVKAIEALYTDASPILLELLRKNPHASIPVVVNRMEQKAVEWAKVKEEMTRLWRKLFDQNYAKSLDHRSFYFKQAEKKALLPKTMVQEVRESSDARRTGFDSYVAFMSVRRRFEPVGQPDLTMEYGDREVLGDAWVVLRTVVEELRGASPREQLLELYLDMVENLFCMPHRTEELAAIKAAAKDGTLGKRGKRGTKAVSAKPPTPDGDGSGGDGAGGGDAAAATAAAEKAGSPEAGAAAGAEEEEEKGEDEDEEKGEGEEGGSGSDSDDGPKLPTTGCRPLEPIYGDAKSLCIESRRLLLSNEMMFIFLRYHRHLYERLRQARRCALSTAQAAASPDTASAAAAAAAPADPSQPPSAGPAPPRESDPAVLAAAADAHAQFMAMTGQMLRGELEIAVYEDDVRALLGTSSYELFTLDKLLHKITTHMRMMLQDDQTMRLWELFRYEHSRAAGCGLHVATYHTNCSSVIDEACYVFDYDAASCSMKACYMFDYDAANAA